jgi:two-component sensor histidine kinase
VIASLLNLQSHHVRDPQVLTLFTESRHRVESMALIHERLYQSSDATRLDFTEYIRTLLLHLFAAYNTRAATVVLKLNVDNVTLGVDTAIPCGLILHELVANALKHAFPAGTSGELGIDLHANEQGRFTLRVSDNGIGFPQEIDFYQTESLGLQLVHALTEQLEGTIELQRHGGTTLTLTFTALSYKQRG